MSGTNLTRRHFKLQLKKAGLPAIRLQDLRHTCATILLMVGKHPKFVQDFLRHASISIMLDTYATLSRGHGRWAGQRDGRGSLTGYC